MIKTTELYWDCECETNYIHSAEEDYCPICDCFKDEQPDSRIDEILRQGLSNDD